MRVQSSATIFVVDDDLAVRDSLRALLESHDMEVKEYASAEAFLRDESRAENGCLILDNQMPGMSGLELLQELRKRNDSLPVVMITGNSDPLLRGRAEKAGALAVLDKPIDDEKLIPLVQRSTFEADR